MADCALVFPPQWVPISPYLSMATLQAYLRVRGARVKCVDANLICTDRILSRKYLQSCVDSLASSEKSLRRDVAMGTAGRSAYLEVAKGLVRGKDVPREVERAKKLLRSRSGVKDLARYRRAWRALDDGMYLVSQAHYPLELRFREFEPRQRTSRVSSILDASLDRDQNVFIEPIEREVVPAVLSARARVVGISVVSRHQLVPAVTIARLVKENDASVHVVVGGPFFSMISGRLEGLLPKFPFFDSFVFHDGEEPLFQLLGHVRKDGAVVGAEKIPNLVFRGPDNRARRSRCAWMADLDDLPTPDFSGLPLDEYLSGLPVLPYEISRGCKWRRCVFCDAHRSVSGGYREHCAAKAVEDLAAISRMHRAKHFYFVDMSAPAGLLESLSNELISTGTDIRWAVQTRMVPEVTRRLCRTMYRAGCRELFLGLESGSRRVLELIDKGIDLRTSARVMKDATDEGILASLFVMIGFPTETDGDRERTIKFLVRNRERVDFVELSFFGLFGGTRVARTPSRYGIEKVGRAVPLGESMDDELHYSGKDCYPSEDFAGLIYAVEDRLRREGIPLKNVEAIDADLLPFMLADVHGRKKLRAFLDTRIDDRRPKPTSRISLAEGVKVMGLPFDQDADGTGVGPSSLAYIPSSGKMALLSGESADIVSRMSSPVRYSKLVRELALLWGLGEAKAERAASGAMRALVSEGVVRIA